MTQSELAKALGIDRGSVGRWETGRSVPRQVGIPKVAKILGQSPDWLLEGSGDLNTAAQNVEVLRAERRTLKEIREEVKKLGRQSEAKVKVRHASPAPTPFRRSKSDLAKSSQAKIDKKTLEDIVKGWDSAKPEARLIAALLITGDWSYKLKLMNREVCVDEEVLSLLGTVTA